MRVQSAAGLGLASFVFTYHYIATHLHIQTMLSTPTYSFFAYGSSSHAGNLLEEYGCRPEELRMA